MKYDGICDLSLVAVSDAISSGKVSSTEVLQAVVERLKEKNTLLNCALSIDEELAFSQAAKRDMERSKGQLRGRIHGVPLAHKDMFSTPGRRCSFGSPEFLEPEFSEPAAAISRLMDAGAFSFAWLNMAEFAQNGTGQNIHFGDTCNPWNPEYVSGGSSSGSGAAVAARLTFGSIGSDTGGSIRLPAAACGITGIKPTHGLVSRYGAMPLSQSMDTVGPLARDVRDCARLLTVISGSDSRDTATNGARNLDYEACIDGKLNGLRIGVPDTYFFEAADPSVIQRFESCLDVFRKQGARIVKVDVSMMHDINTYAALVIRVEAANVHFQRLKDGGKGVSATSLARMYTSLTIPEICYQDAVQRRGGVLREFLSTAMSDADVLLTPTIPFEIPMRNHVLQGHSTVNNASRADMMSHNTRPFNYLGLPSVSFPVGFDGNAMPVGVQMVGRPYDEPRLINAIDLFQRETDWHQRRPHDE